MPGGRWTHGLSEPLQRGGAQSLHRGADGQGDAGGSGGRFAVPGPAWVGPGWVAKKDMAVLHDGEL